MMTKVFILALVTPHETTEVIRAYEDGDRAVAIGTRLNRMMKDPFKGWMEYMVIETPLVALNRRHD